MSTPFTTPAGQTWQTLLSEITLAYSERRQAIGQSAYVPEDRDVQSSAYWRTLQGWLESNCTSFIDHVNGPLTDAGDAFLYFTLATWRAAAGLNADGFRRSPLTGATAHGHMQIGDAIGPWIFEDLQKGFGALRWSILTGLTYQGKNKSAGLGVTPSTCVYLRSWQTTNWPLALWNDNIGWVYLIYALGNFSDAGYFFWGMRTKSKIQITDIPVPVSYDCFFYGYASAYISGPPWGPVGFWDGDNMGLEENKYNLLDSVTGVQTTSVTSKLFGDYETNPIEMYPVNCPLSGVVGGSMSIGGPRGLFKWQFTNQ